MDGMRLEVFGNLGRDPEMKYTPQGKAVTEASIAVTIGYGENKKTEWIKAVVWEKTGELFNQLSQKGTQVWLSGTPKLKYWKTKEGEANGQIELTVKEFRILKNGAKKEGSEDEPDFMRD